MEPHTRYENLALSHVLGGLARHDAEDFRGHLQACAACRARVAELRGISHDLDVAARDERRRAADGQPLRRQQPVAPAEQRGRRVAPALIALAIVLATSFWNLHLRTTASAYLAVAEERAAILRDLSAGELVADRALTTHSARVAVTGSRVVLVMTDGGPLGSDERLVAWLEPLGVTPVDRVVLAVGPRPDPEVAIRLDRGAAATLVVTRERGMLSSSGPRGTVLFRVALPSPVPGT
jgi:anti-sigma factor RsiW